MKFFGRLIVTVILWFLFVPGIGQAFDYEGRWPVTKLPVTGNWKKGHTLYRTGNALGRSSLFRNGHYAIYLAAMEPGQSYTLGLRYPAAQKIKTSVMLFDRWPLDPEAKKYKLSMGPVLRSNSKKIEYRWRLGVSSRSQGHTAFIVVEGKPESGDPSADFHHAMSLTTPAIQPIHQIGEGITYLRGPSELLLSPSSAIAAYVLGPVAGGGIATGGDAPQWRPGDLIVNGEFRSGLQGWSMFSDQGEASAANHVAAGEDGLRLWSKQEAGGGGVKQLLQRDTHDIGVLNLQVDLRIDREPLIQASGNLPGFAVELSICYLDIEGKDHCGENAYRRMFTTRLIHEDDRVVRVKRGEWFRFEDDLMALDPRPQVIQSVAISGGVSGGREAWVSMIRVGTN